MTASSRASSEAGAARMLAPQPGVAGGRLGAGVTAVFAPPSALAIRWRNFTSGTRVVASLTDSMRPGRRISLSTAGVLAYCLVFPVTQIGLVTVSGSGHAPGLWALAATAAYTPFYLRHVLYFIRGLHPPGGGWTLAAMAVIIGGALPLTGQEWLPTSFALGVSILIVLPWRWSLPCLAALVAAQVPLSLAVPPDQPAAPSYYAATLLWRTSAVFVPLWLAGAVLQLDKARRELAEDAVVRERLRADADLRSTLGAALASIVARGQRSASLAESDPAAAGPELAALVEVSRGTLAEARQLISGYHQPSLWAELETAASLLAAAGIETRLALPAGAPPNAVGAGFRSGLRSTMATLLRDETVRSCLLTITSRDGQVQLDIRVDDQHLASMPVLAS
jgi:two-component system sensor histidine kinase DesK